MLKKLLDALDSLVYVLVAPFGILYVFPRFFLGLEQSLGVELPRFLALKYTGVLLMNLGGILALSCLIIMHFADRGSISPFTKPTQLVRKGPYALVRHPMMWAGKFVLIGLTLIYSSPLLLLWLIIWSRFAVVYIDRYEEPYLLSVFGDSYSQYCQTTPRWWPHIKKPTSVT